MCTSPNIMTWTGKYHPSGKPKLNFLPHCKYDDILKSGIPFIQVPCGKCLECRIQHSKMWADRCVLEAKQYDHNYFVTLTYDILPPAWHDDNSGKFYAEGSLYPKDLQNFLKRLRKRFQGINIRFLASGEYGSSSLRCHFHLILFNCPLDDLSTTFKMLVDGKEKIHILDNPNYYFSQTIYDAWHKKGMITVCPFNFTTAQYVANYVTKKINKTYLDKLDHIGYYPEFLRMSNRPGIGADAFDLKYYANGHIIIPSQGKAHVSSIPRYFDKLFIRKYGDDVFDNSERLTRLQSKFENQFNYINGDLIQEQQNSVRENKILKRQIFSTKL